ncbi:MAG: hypothetical protein LBC89_04255, partial [Bacteroidales bacterium]|nr:hypothetical protein [Bacteroidales bacterium]
MNKTNQTTLFRFVNMRSPELTKKENQDKRFVFYPEGTTGGVFHIAVKNKAANATKWEAMLKAAKDFTPFATAQQIEEAYSPYFELADWVSRNKSTLNPEELAAAITKLHEQNLDAENKFLEALSGLWDNLFYQVLMQKDFYVKETVMQLLVLQNILRNQTQLYYKELAAQLLNAKVVLPKELFDELALKLSETITDAEDNDNVVPQALVEAQQIEEAKIASANIARVLSEIEGLEGEHCE